ncbi:hypothetical protein ACVW00_001465 [Marmoricola sp. URHA0025 HA25]
MIELDEQLQRLADGVAVPTTGPEDDLARGRARRRHRNLGALGAAVTTAAVIGTSVLLLPGGADRPGTSPGFAGSTSPSDQQAGDPPSQVTETEQVLPSGPGNLAEDAGPAVKAALEGYRDVLREDLDPSGTRIQAGTITNRQSGGDSLGTKLSWNGGGMLQVAVGHSLEGVQFFCDGVCTRQSLAGASKALVLTSAGRISVAVFQDDGDIVALTADTSFGNNGTSTRTLDLTVDQLLAAAADPRLDLPGPSGIPTE